MRDIFNIVFVLIGTMIGAGFASGKEILIFFNKYGKYGIGGIILSCIFFYLIIYFCLNFAISNKKYSYNFFVNKLFGKKISKYIFYFINIFLLLSFFIMVAGFSSFLREEFNFSILTGSTLVALLLFLILINNSNGILKLNTILIPFLILIFILLFLCDTNYCIPDTIEKKGFILDSLLYTSYNSITIIPIIISFSKKIKNIKSIKIISIFSTIIFAVLAFIIYFLLNKLPSHLYSVELPILYLSKQFGFIKYFYGFSIMIAIFTSAVSAGFSFLENTKNNIITAFIICILSVPFSYIGFSKLVEFFYPLFGYFGFIQILLLLLKKKDKTDINYIRL